MPAATACELARLAEPHQQEEQAKTSLISGSITRSP